MSHELLVNLDMWGTFSSSPSDPRQDLFVPFQELTGDPLEQRLSSLITAARRVALVGPSGCGKSSLAHYVARRANFAGIEIQVNTDPEVAREERSFGQHLVRAIGRWARLHGAIEEEDLRRAKAESSDREERAGPKSTTKFGGGANFVVVRGDLARELGDEEAKIDQKIPTSEIAEVVGRMVELIRYREMVPVIVVDDSDRWLSDADRESVDVFFGRMLRWVANFRTGLIVAVHDQYRGFEGYRACRGQGWLEEEMVLPELTSPDQVGRIMAKRIDSHAPEEQLGSVFERAAIEELFAYYSNLKDGGGRLSLRKTLTTCQEAVKQAAEDPEAEVVTAPGMRAAISAFV